mmetsp:Transcript_36276/g.54745  ORF Transcript_36276/g.54745 Transcript_36276/m.54745 type:complete len:324 (-) Transcript_36276:337-1308(-)|eukprot:CAMPEP_0206467570 /NCGR_PEP_ID=MMETSP0324_2-20121206/29115_1 /ASSEMBLY_ACC=CAM_ASM_000836 /TAXON_ID=2866 /ORGANISM="Crypthecodinium cohnii, Strain Seligo" /LENGTH=323 /DNA_ID=CAMNT_0053940867 /DNA_START=130 /DNA_END=1101 /DNA_ORIENTATION=-
MALHRSTAVTAAVAAGLLASPEDLPRLKSWTSHATPVNTKRLFHAPPPRGSGGIRCEMYTDSGKMNWADKTRVSDLELEYVKPDVVKQRGEILKLLQPQVGERILDVGCGPGFLMADLSSAVGPQGHVEGCDLSGAMIERAAVRLQGCDNTRVTIAGAEILPYPDSSFDAVVISQVLLYVESVPQALAEAHRVLKPNGRLVICDTDWSGLVVNTKDQRRFQRIYDACMKTFQDPYIPRQLPGWLEAGSFDLKEVRTVLMSNIGKAAGDGFMTNWAFRMCPQKGRAAQVAESDIEGWLKEQTELHENNAFFAAMHRFLFLARKK